MTVRRRACRDVRNRYGSFVRKSFEDMILRFLCWGRCEMRASG